MPTLWTPPGCHDSIATPATQRVAAQRDDDVQLRIKNLLVGAQTHGALVVMEKRHVRLGRRSLGRVVVARTVIFSRRHSDLFRVRAAALQTSLAQLLHALKNGVSHVLGIPFSEKAIHAVFYPVCRVHEPCVSMSAVVPECQLKTVKWRLLYINY